MILYYINQASCSVVSVVWTFVKRLAPLFGGPLGLANFGRCKLTFGCNSSCKNSIVSSFPSSISSYRPKKISINNNNKRKNDSIYYVQNITQTYFIYNTIRLQKEVPKSGLLLYKSLSRLNIIILLHTRTMILSFRPHCDLLNLNHLFFFF